MPSQRPDTVPVRPPGGPPAQALAYGEDIERAFELACSEIDRASLPDEDVPRIVGRGGGTAFVRRHT